MALPPILYPPQLQALINRLGHNVGGDRPDPARQKVEAAIQSNPGLGDYHRQQLMAWLGGGDLLDPALVAWANEVTGGTPPQGAGKLGAGATQVAGPGIGMQGLVNAGPNDPENGNIAPGSVPGGASPGIPGGAPPVTATPTAPPPLPGLPAAGGPPATPGAPGRGLADESVDMLLEDPAARNRFATRGAGLDPLSGGRASEFFQKNHAPQFAALAELYGYLPGRDMDGSADGDPNRQSFAGDLQDYAKRFVTGGGNGYGFTRQMAQQVLSNPEFMAQLQDFGDTDQMGMLTSASDLLHAGSGNIKQAWLQKKMQDLEAMYNDSDAGLTPGSTFGNYGGKFTNFLDKDPAARAIAERLFGYKPR